MTAEKDRTAVLRALEQIIEDLSTIASVAHPEASTELYMVIHNMTEEVVWLKRIFARQIVLP